jgi:hypothetical protein
MRKRNTEEQNNGEEKKNRNGDENGKRNRKSIGR